MYATKNVGVETKVVNLKLLIFKLVNMK